MEIHLAESAGFCFGVRRAVELVEKEIEKNQNQLYTYGPIIHNEEVIKSFEAQGVIILPEEQEVTDYEPGTVVIRSHGVGKSTIHQLNAAGFEVIDATCPFVKKIHRIVHEYSKKEYYILIIGNSNHPEVIGITGWINGNDYIVVSTKEELEQFSVPVEKQVCIVSQTTFNYRKFQEYVEIIKEKGYTVSVLNTICSATEERQKEACDIAQNVEAMIVIGGKQSSNSQKLFEICKKECDNTYFIQTKDDLDLSVLQSINNVGITAGASTPNNIIEEVQKYVRNEF